MLLEFSCSNHRSIRDEVLFSLIAGTDKTHNENIEQIAGLKILKAAVIYGANGSGKSNFIDAISFVKNLVIDSVSNKPGDGILQVPLKLEGYEKKSVYKIQFMVNNVRYAYGFSLINTLVSDEYLFYFPNNRKTKIFERIDNNFTAGSNFRNKFNTCKDVLKPNRLMLSCAANFSSVDEALYAYNFFKNGLVIYSSVNQDNWMNYSLHQINKNEQTKNIVLNFLDSLGTGIKDIKVEIKKEEVDISSLPPFLSDEFKKYLSERIDKISAKVIYEDFDTNLLTEESTGIKKLFGLLCPFIDILTNGKVLICDELESNLHESLLFFFF